MICICSCSKSLQAPCKNALLRLFLILLFNCRSFDRIVHNSVELYQLTQVDLRLSLTVRTIWNKCMDYINNVPYQLLKKVSTTKIKAKTLKQLKSMKYSEFINNNLYYYLKPTDSLAPTFYGQPKIHKAGVSIRPIASYSGSPLYDLNKYLANILNSLNATSRWQRYWGL